MSPLTYQEYKTSASIRDPAMLSEGAARPSVTYQIIHREELESNVVSNPN